MVTLQQWDAFAGVMPGQIGWRNQAVSGPTDSAERFSRNDSHTMPGFRLRNRNRRRLGIQVADISHRADPLGSIGQRTEFLAQVTDVDVNTAIKRGKFAVEPSAEKVFSWKHAPARFHKHFEKIEFNSGQLDDLTAQAAGARSPV